MGDPRAAHLERARTWLQDPTAEAIRCAALEVRLLIEELTYEKLRAASDIIPPAVLKTWQPPQAVKALLEFDEFADQSFEVQVGEHPTDSDAEQVWLSLGSHHALTLQWIRKNYNKVGSLLHAPQPGDKAPADAA